MRIRLLVGLTIWLLMPWPTSLGVIRPATGQSAETDFKGQRWAVVIGVAKYAQPRLDTLKFADHDAADFRDFLESPSGGAFPAANVLYLENENATADAVRDALGTFLMQAKEEDYVVVFLAGHGVPDPNDTSEFYFLPSNAQLSHLASTAIPMGEIHRWIGKIKAERVVVIADTCHSGAIADDGAPRAAGNGVHGYLKKLADSFAGKVVITSSRSYQISQEDVKWGGGHGVFSFFLLKGLKEDSHVADKNKDETVDLNEAYTYVVTHVMEETGSDQFPDMAGDLGNGIPLAVVTSEPAPAPTLQTTRASAPQEPRPLGDEQLWSIIKDGRNRSDFETFLRQYPQSALAPYAENRIREIDATERTTGQRSTVASSPVEAWYRANKRGFVRDAPNPESNAVSEFAEGDEFYVPGKVAYGSDEYFLVEKDRKHLGYVFSTMLTRVGEAASGSSTGAGPEPDGEVELLHSRIPVPVQESRVANCQLRGGAVLKLAPETCESVRGVLDQAIRDAGLSATTKTRIMKCEVKDGRILELARETCEAIEGRPYE